MKRFPPKRVLVAADLSAPSLSAVAAAKAYALRWDASLEIVHVQQPPMPALWAGVAPMPASLPPVLRENTRLVESKLRAAAAGFPPDQLKVSTVRGWPPEILLDLSRTARADLLVMGTHGYAGLDRLLTGSVAEAVVRRATIPVLAVPEGRDAAEITRVLAPWNASPYATRALRWARDVARSLGATLDVLHVAEPGRAVDESWASLDRMLLAVLGAGPDWTLRARRGDARKCIIEEANSGRYGLVVLSAHRRRFGADFVLGSTVERLLRHTSIPVMAVPSGVPGHHAPAAPSRSAVRQE
ncbi:MAG: universal stress protein [Elusimicrobiota bacterium]